MKKDCGICLENGISFVDLSFEHPLGEIYTVFHESVHGTLMDNSSYGVFLNLLFQLSIIDKNIFNLVDLLRAKMKKPHECIATGIEYLIYKEINGDKKFNEAIAKLKDSNKEYYKYLNELLFLIKNDSLDYKDKINLIWIIGFNTFAIDLRKLDINSFSKKARLESNLDKNFKLLPNYRFNLIIKSVKNSINSSNSSKFDNIIENINSLEIETVFANDFSSEDILNYVKEIASSLENSDKLLKRLNNAFTINDTRDNYLMRSPCIVPLKQYPLEEIYLDKFKKDIDFDACILNVLFLPPSLIKDISLSSDPDICKNGGMKLLITSIINKKIFLISDLKDPYSLIGNNNLVTVFDFLFLVDNNEFLQWACSNFKKTFYVLSRFPYDLLVNQYPELLSNKSYFRIVDYPTLKLIVIYVSENLRLLLILDYISFIKFLNDLKKETCNLKTPEIKSNFSCNFDPFIIRNYSDKLDLDLIINCHLNI